MLGVEEADPRSFSNGLQGHVGYGDPSQLGGPLNAAPLWQYYSGQRCSEPSLPCV